MTNALHLDIPAGVPFIDFAREFDAPVEAVFRAHRDPELVRQWLGPRGYEMDIERWDFTTGGGYRYVHRTRRRRVRLQRRVPHGPRQRVRHPDLRVRGRPRRGAHRVHAVRATSATAAPGCEGRSIGRTVEARDGMVASGMENGMAQGYERLDELVVAARPPAQG